ncbi:uncharacterized protein LOC131180789 [Hevea brasiliensis]|uniref:uncharacterized protein LOC131180789 n=1 Tax=Hevea brasiliensis TaxID=3981 RepID=UPI0025F8C274|nr:uncharacterized protein LOC131180789 [Hevea brasiliensis]
MINLGFWVSKCRVCIKAIINAWISICRSFVIGSFNFFGDSAKLESAAMLHSKKRNRLFQERLDNLVYVKYNRALLCQQTFGDITTPVDLANIDESNEWLLSECDGDDNDDNSLVFMNGVLTWGDVGRATGVFESRYESRSAARSTPVETPSFRRPRAMRGASSSQVDDDEEEEEFVMVIVENEDDFENLNDE